MRERNFEIVMENIIQAMREKGYDHFLQLKGYLLENEPGYITRHNGARELIQELEIEQVRRYVETIKNGIQVNEVKTK